MKKHYFAYEMFSKYRGAIMGIQILLIVFFHFTEDCKGYNIRYSGIVYWFYNYVKSSGVDIFLLVSGLGLYYSLWDRKINGDVADQNQDAAYNEYMIKQLKELISIAQRHTHIVEFWFDGGWVKQNYRWPVMDIYQTIKSKEPNCQIGINWSIGSPENPDAHLVHPDKQKAGFPIRYFPSDFRLGDPYLPADNDPKVFTHDGKNYYMPWESTICISERWFYNTTDTKFKSIDELERLYKQCTKNDNILILNCPPNRNGQIRSEDINILKELRTRLNL